MIDIELVRKVCKRTFKNVPPTLLEPLYGLIASGSYKVYEQGHFTVVVLAVPPGEQFVGVTKWDNKDAFNPKLGEMTALCRAIQAAVRPAIKMQKKISTIVAAPQIIAASA